MPDYYFLAGDEVRGPFGLADCFLMIDRGTLLPATQICEAGTEDWRTLAECPQFKDNRQPIEADKERVLWRGHPSYWNYLGSWFWGLLLLPVGIGFLILLNAYFKRRGTKYLLTTSKAAIVSGLFVTSSREVRLSDIRSINIHRRGVAGLFGLGTVEFSSAAHDAATVFFYGILPAEEVVDAVRTVQDGGRAAPLPGSHERDSTTGPVLAFAVLASVPLTCGLMVANNFRDIHRVAESYGEVSSTSTPGTRTEESVPTEHDPALAIPAASNATPEDSASRGESLAPVARASAPMAVQTPTVSPARTFAIGVAESQRRAVSTYPALGQANSPLNLRFRVRLDEWRARGDTRLTRPNWPEQLAAECAAGISTVANR